MSPLGLTSFDGTDSYWITAALPISKAKPSGDATLYHYKRDPIYDMCVILAFGCSCPVAF